MSQPNAQPRLEAQGARRALLDADVITRYLDRLGIDDPGEPSVSALHALHRAHVERIPYEVLEIQLRRHSTLDPQETIEQILRGRGGYCVQINSAFLTLLSALGYQVTWHGARVQMGPTPLPPEVPSAPHLASTVDIDGQRWFVDVGLGDGLHDPLPLRAGAYAQGPVSVQLRASEVVAGGWRFDHDPVGSVTGLDFPLVAAAHEEFAAWHPWLTTSPESRLVRAVAVLRRDATTVYRLAGCMLHTLDTDGKSVTELATQAEWFGALADVFGMPMTDTDPEERAALWTKVHTAHQSWLAAKASRSKAETTDD